MIHTNTWSIYPHSHTQHHKSFCQAMATAKNYTLHKVYHHNIRGATDIMTNPICCIEKIYITNSYKASTIMATTISAPSTLLTTIIILGVSCRQVPLVKFQVNGSASTHSMLDTGFITLPSMTQVRLMSNGTQFIDKSSSRLCLLEVICFQWQKWRHICHFQNYISLCQRFKTFFPLRTPELWNHLPELTVFWHQTEF